MAPKIVYNSPEEKKQAMRNNALKYYYKKRGLDYIQEKENKMIKKYVQEFLSSTDQYKKVYDLIIKNKI
jgi:hypothetical protein